MVDRRWTVGLAGLVAAAAFFVACEQSTVVQPGPEAAGITVSGRGEIAVTPDTGKVTIGVEVTRTTVGDAREAAAKAATAVIDSAKSNRVDAKDVRTVGLSISPRYEYPRNGVPVITGYTVTNSVAVTVRDLGKFSEIVDEAVEAGGNDVRLQGVSFEVSDREKALRDAREAAVKDARSRADQLAKTAGVDLGDALSISEVSSTPPAPIYAEAQAKDQVGSVTPIEPGSTVVVVEVQVRWAIR